MKMVKVKGEGWLPNVKVSSHALDRLSERALDYWIDKGNGKGIMSFLIQKSREAYLLILKALDETLISIRECSINYDGLTYCFSTANGITSLTTVYKTTD